MAVGPYWSVIVPVGRTNLITNPSLEYGTAGWGTIQAGTFGTTSNFQQFGAWSGSVAPTSNGTTGCMSPTFTVGNGTDYTFSAYVRGANGVAYKLGVGDSNGANLVGSINFTGNDTWQRVVGSWTEASGATRRVVLKKNADVSVAGFYIDAVQVEVGSCTTYLDGDQDGCYWNGAVHQSQSIRSGTYRGGGSVISLQSQGWIVDEEPGVGMPPLEITAQSFALLSGAEFQRVRAAERSFVIESTFIGTSTADLHITRRRAIDLFKIDLVDPQQPTRFLYAGGQGTVQIDAVYAGGGEFTKRDGFTEITPIRFVAHSPYFEATTDQGTALLAGVAAGAANYAVRRDPLGRWGTMNGGFSNPVNTLHIANAGSVYFGGQFVQAAGTQARFIALWNGDGLGTLTGGTVNDNVNTILMAPGGTLYVGGDFIVAGGTQARYIAQHANGSWGTLTGGTLGGNTPSVFALALAPYGTLYVGGAFGTISGTVVHNSATIAGIAQYNGAWGSLTGGTLRSTTGNAHVNAIAIGNNGTIYLSGRFGTAAAIVVGSITQWNGAYGSLGSGASYGNNPRPLSLGVGPSGLLYAAGIFGTLDTTPAANIGAWNGIQWSALGSGVGTAGTTPIYSMDVTSDGRIFVVGSALNRIGQTPLPANSAGAWWNGYTWLPLDVQLTGDPAGADVRAVGLAPDGALYVVGAFSAAPVYAAGVTLINNTGRTDSLPIARIWNRGGNARIYQLINVLTGAALYFDLIVLAGETVTLDFRYRTFTSDFRGDIFSSILPGSNLASWNLQQGTNWISYYAENNNLDASFYWRPRHWSADGGTVM